MGIFHDIIAKHSSKINQRVFRQQTLQQLYLYKLLQKRLVELEGIHLKGWFFFHNFRVGHTTQ